MKKVKFLSYFSLLPLVLIGSPTSPEIKIHKEQDIFIQVGDEHLYNLQEIITELNEHPNIIEEPEQIPLTCRQRLAKNRNALIVAGVSLGSATISGVVALIVHFTAQR